MLVAPATVERRDRLDQVVADMAADSAFTPVINPSISSNNASLETGRVSIYMCPDVRLLCGCAD
jgi:hypothetical protein